MPPRFNEARYAEVVAEEANLKGILATLSQELEEEHGSIDGTWTQEQNDKYMAKQQLHAQRTRELNLVLQERQGMELSKPNERRENKPSALDRFLRRGWEGLEKDEIEAHRGERDDLILPGGGGEVFIVKGTGFDPTAGTASDAASGQEAVPETIPPSVVDRLAYYDGVSQMAQHFMTSTGNEFRVLQMDAASQEGALIAAQDTAVTELDLPNIGVVTFGAKTAHSKTMGITREMITDSVFDIESYVERQATRRLGRLWENAFTTTMMSGGDVIGPLGCVSLASAGITASAANTFTWVEITNLIYAINRAYRMAGEGGTMGSFMPETGGRIGYMISDDAEKIIRTMSDMDNRPLWVPSTREGMPNMLNGYPYAVNGHMASVATGTVPVLFGNFSYFGIRTVNQIEIFSFQDSRTMQKNRIEILAFSRRDSRNMSALVSNAIEPIVKLTMG